MAALIFWQSETFADFLTPLTLCSLGFLPIGDEVADAEEILAPLKLRERVGDLQSLTIPAKFAWFDGRQLELSVPPARVRRRRGEEASANFKFERDHTAILPTE